MNNPHQLMINYIDKKNIIQRIGNNRVMNPQFPRAVPLVTFSQTKGYSLHPSALEVLKMLPDNDDYAVVTVVGKSKTGKSFLMNEVLEDESMFEVSNHIGNCTKGIMLATKFIQVDSVKVLILDTEGFGSTEGNDDRDCKLFILSLLLSTVIMYNSLGTIDQQTLNNLSMIIEVGKMFEKELDNKNSIPALLWTLRDFSLKLQDKNGFPITSHEYLENSLEEQKGSSQTSNHKNRIRRVIKALFKQRSCQTLVLPNDEIPSEAFQSGCTRPEFVQDIKRFKKKLCGMVSKKGCKKFCGQKMSITNFIEAIEIYVEAFNRSLLDGSLPKIQNLTFQLRKNQAKSYKNKFTEFLNNFRTTLIEEITSFNGSSLTSERKNKIIEPVQSLYEITKNNLYELTGEQHEQQLDLIKKQFYDEVERECEQILIKQQKQNYNQSLFENEHEINNLCQFFSHILDESELDHQYSTEIHKLKENNIKADQFVFANMLMKLEIAFLRRKVQLSKETNLQVERLTIELQYAKKQISKLESRNKDLEDGVARQSRNKYATPNKSGDYLSQDYNNRRTSTIGKEPGYIRTSNHKSIQETKSRQLWKVQSTSKIESSSFYIPYVLIHKSSYINSRIIRTLIKEDSKKNNYIEYVIDVSLQGQKWSLNRKFKDFSELHSILVMMFQNQRLPECNSIVGPLKLADSNSSNRKEVVEQRRRELQNYLCELVQNQNIRNSRILQKFLKINKEYTVV